MWDTLKEWVSSPIFGLILCGYVPGILFLFSAWRISRKGEITTSSPNYSRQNWRKPATFKGKDIGTFVNTYIMIGVFILIITTTILFSIILH
jgi:hypothetical protein